ncbi:MAG: asparagine synthase (glutamine-hydrolyzing) [Bacteroidetes bacterium]|nr:asparagine synthase (glutamine-hydrolyzing) [Bacteroidota bacterium]
MCGILGVVGAPHEAFAQALDRLAHRGPDGAGIWTGEDAQLGHRRLSILDLSTAANQPMVWGRYILVFNGEIYNFLELRQRLVALGHTFSTDSDTEVLLHAYRQWGVGCLSRFNGMWAFALWDTETRQLFFARDRFGVKPFYYFSEEGRMAFGSEQKALLRLQRQPAISPHFARLSQFRLSYESTAETLLAGIHRLPAGHYGTWQAGKIQLTRYWNTLENLEAVPADYDAQCAGWRARFLDACRLRNRSDVPVATALSGGLDSSSIFCAQHYLRQQDPAPERQPQALHAFAAIFPGTEQDETAYAQAVLAHTGRPGTLLEMQFSDDFDRLMEGYYYMEDLWPSSPVPMITLYREMRKKGFLVSLDGHGGDELLAGYHTGYYALAHTLPHAGQTLEILDAYPENHDLGVWQRLAKALHFVYMHRRWIGRAHLLRFLHSLELPAWVTDRLGLPGRSTTPEYMLDALQAMNYQLFHQSVLPTLLRNYDRFSMAASVESRAPFLDYRLVTYSFSLGWQSMVHGGYTKSVMRDALKGILTPAVATRKSKIGFNAPNTRLLRNQWRAPLERMLHTAVPDAALQSTPIRELATRYTEALADSRQDAQLAACWQQMLPLVWQEAFFKRAAAR